MELQEISARIRAGNTLAVACRVAVVAGFSFAGSLGAQTVQVYDIPSGGSPSPLFGAQPFTQRLVDFEEIGLRPMPSSDCADCAPLPQPIDCRSSPDSLAIDAFLKQPLSTLPTRLANTTKPNPWAAKIATCVRPLGTTAMEGRPPGEWFSHQRWDEFQPQVYAVTMQAGARTNTGLRDSEQLHGYRTGEFGPGGLYHNTTGFPGFDGTTRGIEVRLHPNMPVQNPNSVWTFDGTLPYKVLMARTGETILLRHYDGLPIDAAANNGFGANTLSTHLHNGHNPGESDGFPHVFFFPGQFYDYVWPMVLARHDKVNTSATDVRAGRPDPSQPDGIRRVRGDYRETASTLWFHDHMLDFTAQNVYKGNAAAINIYSAIDRGNESFNCNYANAANPNLCLPSGSVLPWGNRDYDHNIMIADKATDRRGQLWFNTTNLDGFVGDIPTVNSKYKPYMEVRARKYRFRILNGSIARYYKLALVDQTGKTVPFYMIGNDGNIMEHAIPFDGTAGTQRGVLPTLAIAERYDIIVDFSTFTEGQRLYLVNLMEHKTGRGPEAKAVPLAAAFNGTYVGDPVVGRILEFRVKAYSGVDTSMNPADYVPGRRKMIERNTFTTAELATAPARTFTFGRSGGTDNRPWVVKTDGGASLSFEPNRLTAEPTRGGSAEKWTFVNGGGGWSHPIHVHFEEGHVISRDGLPPPVWERWARKDVFRVGPEVDSSVQMTVAYRFSEFNGSYVEHCHNTMHEDHAMMVRYDIKNPNQKIVVPTPFPDWDGVYYQPTVLEKFGDTDADYVPDDRDNCLTRPNPRQTDADADGYGNQCDADLNNDGLANAKDLDLLNALLAPAAGANALPVDAVRSGCPQCDLNDDGSVNLSDIDLLKGLLGLPLGPAAGK